MITQNSSKLEQLVEFAEKGGIGTCVANQDIIAKSEADLMFYTGEVITVLKHIKDDIYLGYCEGVIGTFRGKTVDFNGSLKNLKSMKSEKRSQVDSDQRSPKQSPKQANFLRPSDSARLSPSSISDDSNSGSSDMKIDLPSSPGSPTINIIPDNSENIYNDNQNNVPIIIQSQRKTSVSSVSSERSIPISPRKHSTLPQLSPSPEPIISQRRNNTVPIIAINQEQSSSINSNQVVSNDKRINSRKIYSPSQNQVDQIITRKRQNSTPTAPQNITIERPNSKPNGPRIPGVSNASVSHNIETSKLQRNEHHRSTSIPNINRVHDSSSQYNNKRYSQTFDSLSSSPTSPTSPTSPKSVLYKSHKNSPSGSISSIVGYPEKASGRNSPSSNSQMQKYLMRINNDGISQNSIIGHYSPSTTPLPSPKMLSKVFGEEVDGQYSTSTTPLPSPRFTSRKMSNNNSRNYEGHITAPAPTPITPKMTAPKITLEESDLDDSDVDQEETLISYASSRNNSLKSSSSYNPPKPVEVSTLKVEQISYSRSDTPSEQFSANESDISSEDEDESKDESKVEVKNESESIETQSSKSVKKKKDQILAIDEYGFVYDVAEEDIPPGADRIQRIIQAPGTEEKTTRTIRLYREREAKWVALLGSMTRDSKKIKKLVRQGIPESVRGKAWQFMSGADKYRRPNVFDELRNRSRLPIYDVIERDIHRCYPDHIQFREETGFGQDDLHNILKAYAHYNQAVGYCQGMGRLVGMMLMQMPAEDTFWLLVATIEEYMVGYFTPTLSQVRIDSIVFEQLLVEYYPKLAQHLSNNGVIPLMYMTQWFMTIFTMALPWASVLRVWDIFYFEGVKLFFRIGLAIMDCTREHILKNCPTSSEILQFLLHIPHELLTPDLLLEAAYKIRLKRSVIRRMTKRAIAIEKNNEVGSDAASIITAGSNKETRKGLMKKSKSADKLRIDGIEFKLVGE